MPFNAQTGKWEPDNPQAPTPAAAPKPLGAPDQKPITGLLSGQTPKPAGVPGAPTPGPSGA
ncbi:MAG: hypothetical protein V3R81_09390, partial [Gammaproteobacteria bacterium]